MARAGFNYARGAHSFGAYYRLNPEKGDFTNNGTEWLDNDPALRRIIDRRIRAHSHFVYIFQAIFEKDWFFLYGLPLQLIESLFTPNYFFLFVCFDYNIIWIHKHL